MAQIETGMVCGCGLPMSRNPHPDAGKPDMDGVVAGYEYECIPCLVATRNRVGASWRKAEAHAARLEAVSTAAYQVWLKMRDPKYPLRLNGPELVWLRKAVDRLRNPEGQAGDHAD